MHRIVSVPATPPGVEERIPPGCTLLALRVAAGLTMRCIASALALNSAPTVCNAAVPV